MVRTPRSPTRCSTSASSTWASESLRKTRPVRTGPSGCGVAAEVTEVHVAGDRRGSREVVAHAVGTYRRSSLLGAGPEQPPTRFGAMELRIGVVHTPKELNLELDGTADEIVGTIDKAMTDGTAIVWVTDSKGRRVGIPTAHIAYVEVDEDGANKRVGFGR